jgi:hypothetical protein
MVAILSQLSLSFNDLPHHEPGTLATATNASMQGWAQNWAQRTRHVLCGRATGAALDPVRESSDGRSLCETDAPRPVAGTRPSCSILLAWLPFASRGGRRGSNPRRPAWESPRRLHIKDMASTAAIQIHGVSVTCIHSSIYSPLMEWKWRVRFSVISGESIQRLFAPTGWSGAWFLA